MVYIMTLLIAIAMATGRQVTMCNLYDWLHRGEEGDQQQTTTTKYSERLDRFMNRLFSSGLSTGLDMVVLVVGIPSLLLAPSTWHTGE